MGSQTSAARKTVRVLKSRLGDEHAALVAMFVGLAEQIDSLGVDASAGLWKEFRSAESALRAVGEVADDPDSDGSRSVGLPAAVGD